MTPEEFKQEMIEIRDLDDETAKKKYGATWFSSILDNHIYADNLMCQVLEELGYGEGVKIFHEIEKWYD